jgi:hypothetical protein
MADPGQEALDDPAPLLDGEAHLIGGFCERFRWRLGWRGRRARHITVLDLAATLFHELLHLLGIRFAALTAEPKQQTADHDLGKERQTRRRQERADEEREITFECRNVPKFTRTFAHIRARSSDQLVL